MTTPTFTDILSLISGVDGWLSTDQAQVLYGAATRCRCAGRIVEIGSFRGRSTIVLAAAAPDGVDIVALDPHAGNDRGPQEIEGFEAEAASDAEIFRENLVAAGVADRVHHVAAFSSAAHDLVDGSPISLLYVDGAHRFKPALQDLRSWGARLEDGGTLLVHDSFSSVGVTLAIFRHLFASRRFRYLGRAGSLSIYAVGPVDTRGRLASSIRLAAQLPWFVRNVVIKSLIVCRLGGLTKLLGHREPTWPY